MRRASPLAATAVLALLGGCATTPIVGGPAVTVVALVETPPVGTAAADAADDIAIWRNPDDPSKSLIVGTDKKAGLHVYGIDGRERSFAGGGLLNNVDLVDLGPSGVVVVASDRNDPLQAKLQAHRLNKDAGTLSPMGTIPVGPGESYGVCLSYIDFNLDLYAVLKDGRIEQLRSNERTGAVDPVLSRRVATQAEGCVVDPRDGTLYVGEENAGIWRFAAGSATGELVARVDNVQLVADVEGLARAPDGDPGGYLVASSQGDNAYAVFRLPDMTPVGRFRIGQGALGAVEETDGIALDTGDFGPQFPGGLFIAQDGRNEPRAQNFKFVSWAAIKEALGLE